MTILTDLSEVLIHGVIDVGKVITERYGAEVGERYARRVEETREVFHDLLRGRLTEDRYFDILLGGEYWPFEPGHLEWIFTEEFRKEIPGTLSVYRRIAAHPRSLTDPTMEEFPSMVVVSDHIEEHTWEIECYHADIFLFAWDPVWSCDVGMIKSDPGFFPKILEMLELEPDECVFVDDSERNVAAAEAAGIKSIRFQSAEQLESELTALGFEFYA